MSLQESSSNDMMSDARFGQDNDDDARALAHTSIQLRMVQARGLQATLASAARMLRLVNDPEYNAMEVTGLVESDPGLATRVLGLANSALFDLRRPCSTVGHAVALLGGRALGEIAAAAALADLYRSYGLEGRLRSHAMSTAAVVRELALQLGLPTQDLFLAGLLHDVGKLVLLQSMVPDVYGSAGSTYRGLLDQRLRIVGGTHPMEQASLGFEHGVLAGVMLSSLGIPEPIPRVIGWHHSVELALQAGGRAADQVCLLRVADSLSHAFSTPSLVDDAVQSALMEHVALGFLGVDERSLEGMASELHHAHFSSRDLLS